MNDLAIDRTLRARWQPDGDGFVCDVPEGWMQGRSVFGGLTAALMAALGRRHVGDGRVLRGQSMSLARPVSAGALSGQVATLRQGKGVHFVEVRLRQNGETVATASLTFVALRRPSVRVEGPPRWRGPDPDSLPELPYLPGLMPEFVQRVDMRWASGAPPFSGASDARFEGYCRFRGPSGDAEGLLALLDVWPSPTLSLVTTPAPASTVTWSAHLLEIPEAMADWYAFSYRTIAGHDGFHTVMGELHGPDGRLVAWTEQLMAIFD
ncbi:MAG: acyl-CoA thioesterase [Sandaracinaceae bacterium]